jgi:hypothetical protein
MSAVRAPAPERRQRRLLIGLGVVFFAPLAASFYLYYGPVAWRPGRQVNRGDLIDPARPLPDVSLPIADHGPPRTAKPDFLKNKWTLLYVGAGGCNVRCRADLYNTRQVRFALNREMDRVQRVFIAEGECCDFAYLEAQHPDLVTVRATAQAAPLLSVLPTFGGVDPAVADRIYVIDPLGNLMMSYAPDSKPKGMLEDLKRLLGLSHVG